MHELEFNQEFRFRLAIQMVENNPFLGFNSCRILGSTYLVDVYKQKYMTTAGWGRFW